MRCGVSDIEKVQRIVSDKDNYYSSSDDGCPSAENLNLSYLLQNPFYFVLMPNEFTAALFYPVNYVLFDSHVSILKHGRGDMGVDAFKKAMQWMFDNTSCKKLMMLCPLFYKPIFYFAQKCGYKEEGKLFRSFLKNGVLYDQIVMGAGMEV